MAFPVSNAPAYGAAGQSLSGITHPTIWSGKLVASLYANTCLSEVANTDYEGEIRNQGDTVKIRTTPTVTISDYQRGQSLAVQKPVPDVVELQVDKGKYWNFIVEDPDEAQADYAFASDWQDDASRQMAIAIERDVFGAIYASADAANAGATAGAISGNLNLGAGGAPAALTSASVIDYILMHGQALDEQNAPVDGRFILLPASVCRLLKSSDLKDASITGDGQSVLRNGRLGMIDRFTIYNTNLLAMTGVNSDEINIIAGHKSALTFASQYIKNETLRAESTFGTMYRGLNVFGYKVIQPKALTHGVVTA